MNKAVNGVTFKWVAAVLVGIVLGGLSWLVSQQHQAIAANTERIQASIVEFSGARVLLDQQGQQIQRIERKLDKALERLYGP